MTKKCRCHVLSIRESSADARLLNEIWGQDAEIEIITVRSGAEALTYLKTAGRKLPNIIVLASAFPSTHMTAAEVLRALKTDTTLRCVPVVMLSGQVWPKDTQELYNEGIACVIEMPVDLDSLERTLRVMKELWLGVARLPYEHQIVYPE